MLPPSFLKPINLTVKMDHTLDVSVYGSVVGFNLTSLDYSGIQLTERRPDGNSGRNLGIFRSYFLRGSLALAHMHRDAKQVKNKS